VVFEATGAECLVEKETMPDRLVPRAPKPAAARLALELHERAEVEVKNLQRVP
jgi:hypothetical protein